MYRLDPRYAPAPQAVLSTGWQAVAAQLPTGPAVLAVEGSPSVDWDALGEQLRRELAARGIPVALLDVRAHYAPPAEIRKRTERPEDEEDPYFRKLADNPLGDLFDTLPTPIPPNEGLLIVHGPGAALVDHHLLWYADVPKRYAEACRGRGRRRREPRPSGREARPAPAVLRDWPMLGPAPRRARPPARRLARHAEPRPPGVARRARTPGHVRRSRAQAGAHPPLLQLHALGRALGPARRSASTPSARNTALGYELIAPEAGILVGTGAEAQAEVPFQLMCVLEPEEFLGQEVHARFGTSFPLRFDYLDTVGGGNLSRPPATRNEQYMRDHFGWPYTQHETYYVTARRAPTTPASPRPARGRRRRGCSASRSEGRDRARCRPLDVEDHILSLPAEQRPTVHDSRQAPRTPAGPGNVVLEISATPYLY